MKHICSAKECDEWFFIKSKLNEHEIGCDILRPYKCNQGRCHMKFTTDIQLALHVANYICNCINCGQRLAYKHGYYTLVLNYHLYPIPNPAIVKCSGKRTCKLCTVCDIYTRSFYEHQHKLKCDKCDREYIISPGDKADYHKCTKCTGCFKYYPNDSNHICVELCQYCTLPLSLSHNRDCIKSINAGRNLFNQVHVIKSDISVIKAQIKEMYDILKYGPLSQICIDTVEKLEEEYTEK